MNDEIVIRDEILGRMAEVKSELKELADICLKNAMAGTSTPVEVTIAYHHMRADWRALGAALTSWQLSGEVEKK